ncbi:polyprotein [Phytophthora megakarya]|uniref:Polyprotein n=1 Tax=Phytophthora megakarya TaxID=4795 RepID=A0A225WLY2_9STRA|nr:polyprotein [Phytophthora megakarya]
MANDNTIFHQQPERIWRAREPVLLLGDGPACENDSATDTNDNSANDNSGNDNSSNDKSGNDYSDNDDHFWPPSPKRPRFDEDSLLAEAVLAYAADVGDADDVSTSNAEQRVLAVGKAMNAELKAHADNGYKARLVAKGFKQKFGIDFFETYSPVANMNSIRVVLSVVGAEGYVTKQLDADTAFLKSDLKERVYMEVPYDINNTKNMVCRLDKAIYGLKQAVSAWHKTIHRIFVRLGFRRCGGDECVYVKMNEARYVYVCRYVDDMIIAAKTGEENQEVKTALKNARRYIDDVVNRFNQQDTKVVTNPCEVGLKMTKTQSPKTEAEFMLMKGKPYRALVGCLLFSTTCTRPDVTYIVAQLSRFLENPGQQHWKAAIRVLRYLKSTQEFGIVYNGIKEKVELSAYTDADWGSNLDDRRSVLDPAEAEYMALSLCTQEVLWTRAMLTDMGHEQVGATQVTKQVDIKHHFIQENVARAVVEVNYIPTKDQLAGMLTKGLETKRLQYLMDTSGVLAKAVQH